MVLAVTCCSKKMLLNLNTSLKDRQYDLYDIRSIKDMLHLIIFNTKIHHKQTKLIKYINKCRSYFTLFLKIMHHTFYSVHHMSSFCVSHASVHVSSQSFVLLFILSLFECNYTNYVCHCELWWVVRSIVSDQKLLIIFQF